MVHRIGACCATGATGLGAGEFMPEPVGEPGYDLILHVEKVGDRLVEALGPDLTAGFGVDQLDVDAHAVPRALHAALEHIANVDLAPDLPEIGRFCPYRKRPSSGR